MRIEIPNWQIRAKLIEAAESIPKFKHYIDQLMLKEPREWSNMTHTEILHGLRVAETNSMISEPTPERRTVLSAKPPLSLGKLTNPALTLKRARVQMETSVGSSIPGEVRVLPTRQLTVVISKKDSASLGTTASLSTLKKLECASFSLSAALVQKERAVILNTCSWEGEVAPPDLPEEINHQATTRKQNPRMSTIVLQPLADHRRTFQRRVRKLLATKVTMGKTAVIRGAVQGCSTRGF